MTNIKKLFVTIFTIILLSSTTIVYANDNVKLTPSGNVVEMIITLKHPYVSKVIDEKNKKLETHDIVLYVECMGKKLYSFEDLYEIMKLPNEKIKVRYVRKGKEKSKTMTSDDLRGYQFSNYCGFSGTITALDERGNYVALSHDIKINDTPISIEKGTVLETKYVQESKSLDGKVGHLITTSDHKYIGTVKSMTKYGIQGSYSNFEYDKDKAMEIGQPTQGKAYLYCETPITNEIKFHEIEILEVGRESSKIKIIDKELIDIRGGGVQGMSGSPIIQDGKIVGGMSHVYKKDTKLGIMANIESMLYKN